MTKVSRTNEPGLSFRKHWRQAGEGTQEDLGVTASSSPREMSLGWEQGGGGLPAASLRGDTWNTGGGEGRETAAPREERPSEAPRKHGANVEGSATRRQAESGASSPRGGTSQMLLQDARSARRVRAFTLPR